MTTNREAAVAEAIEVADANLNNVDLPLYSELLAALRQLEGFTHDGPVLMAEPVGNLIRSVIAKANGF
jgi:hypothetical protein